MAHEESLETGMRAFDPDRLREVVAYLAAHVRDLYRTKLNKILFYLDFASYRDTGRGFTGLRYAKADFRAGADPVRAHDGSAGGRRGACLAGAGRRPGGSGAGAAPIFRRLRPTR